MPITPFHFGPGALFKAIGGRRISFTVFVLSQAAIDSEPILFAVLDRPPLHRFLHTYLGALLLALAIFYPLAKIADKFKRWWNSRLSPAQAVWLAALAPTIWQVALTSSLVGCLSHVLIDSVMHHDMLPLAPFAEGNGLWRALSLERLHLVCVLTGVAGLIAWITLRRLRHRA